MRHKNKLIYLLLLLVVYSWGEVQTDSVSTTLSNKTTKELQTEEDSTKQDTAFFKSILLESRSTAKKVVAWPFENVIQPSLSLLIYPIKPPLDYIFQERVIERGLDFTSFGEGKNIMIFPTFSLGSGAESSIGLSYLHKNLVFDSLDRAKFEMYRTIDNDWFYSGSYQKNDVLGLPWTTQAGFEVKRFQNILLYNSTHTLDTTWLRSDSTYKFVTSQEFDINESQSIRLGISNIKNRYKTEGLLKAEEENPLLGSTSEEQENIRLKNQVIRQLNQQGYWSNFESYPIILAYTYNSKESRFTSTSGKKLVFSFGHVPVTQGFGDYQFFEANMVDYYLLGERAYHLDPNEHRKQKRYLRNFGLNEALQFLKTEQWNRIFLQRKVLVNYLSYRQAWDFESDNPAVYDAFSTSGKNSPLRGYPSARFVDYGAINWSTEYRWPLIRMVDGVFFNEYAWTFRGPHNLNPLDYKNSFGFGFRVSQPNFYLTRFNIGFHGPIFSKQPIEGFMIQLTVRPEYKL